MVVRVRPLPQTFAVKVKPRSSRPGVEAAASGELVVRVHAAAVDGAANQEMTEVLARALRVPKSAVHIVQGQSSRTKRVAVAGVPAGEVVSRLRAADLHSEKGARG